MKQEKILMKKEFVAAQTSSDDLKQQFKEVQDAMTKLQKERDQLAEENQHLIDDDQKLKDILREFQTENVKLLEEIAAPCEKCKNLEEALSHFEKERLADNKSKEKIEQLEKELLVVKEKYVTLEKDSPDQKEMERLKKQVAETEERFNNMEKEYNDIKNSTATQGANYLSQVASLEKRLQESEAQAVKCKEFMEQLDRIQTAKLQLENECVTLQQKLAVSVQKLEEWEGMIQLMKDDREKQDAELLELENKERQTQEEMEDLSRSLQEALDEIDALKEQVLQV